MERHVNLAGGMILATALALAAPGVAVAQPVSLADGDSFRWGDKRYRLYGIDAPELNQECWDSKDKPWPCGVRARAELRRIISTEPLTCTQMSVDQYGRIIATCRVGGKDIAEEMVRTGYATAYSRPGNPNSYAKAEAEAREEKRGMWAGRFEHPRTWRERNPRGDAPAEAAGSPSGDRVSDWLRRIRRWLQAAVGL
jgi:endonuclease YncB( thermonuclease family)